MANLTAKFKLIDEMSAKLDKIAQSGRNALSQWEQAGNAIDGAFDGAVTSTVHAAQSIGDSSDSIEELTEATKRATTAADRLADANEEAEEALEDVAKDAEKAADGVEDFGDESEEAGRKSEEFGEKSSDALRDIEELLVGAGIVRGLEAIGEAFVDCVKDAIEFESAITGVYKTVDGTPEQLAAISDEVKEMSLRLPSTTTEIAAVAEAAGQLGIQTDSITSFTEVMINLGEATNLSSDEAASSLAKFANITKMSADQYENLGSTVVALGNNFATTEADIVAMSTRMASAGSLAGLSEPEILALAAAISSVGIEADAGGSSMSTLLSKLQLAVETGNDQLEQFASVAGMTADEFSQKWGENAVDALYAFIAGLNDTERNGASATALLDEMGITEIRLSNAVKALASNHEGLADAVGLANNAWEENTALSKEAETRYSTLESKLAMVENAQTNLSTAIGEVYTPTISAAAEIWGDMLNGITGFVKAHPTAVKAIVAITAGVGAFVVGIVAYTAAAKVAKVATTALTAAMATNPYLLLGAAIAGVVVGLTAFAVSMATAEDESQRLTSASQKQADELEDLRKEYEETCDVYGETSYQAQELAWQIENLEAEYESSKQTMEEYREEFDNAMQSYYDMVDRHEESAEQVQRESSSIVSLVERLDELTQQTDVTAAEQEEILAIIKHLNEEVPGLSLNYDELTNKLSTSADAIMALAQAEIASRKYDEYYEQLIEKMTMREELESAHTEALKNKEAAYEALLQAEIDYDNAVVYANNRWRGATPNGAEQTYRTNYINEYKWALEDAQEAYDEFVADVNEAQTAIDDNEKAIKSITDSMAELNGETQKGADELYTYEEACQSALASVQAEVNDLCQAYDDAYLAARESIDGQIGLFQEMVVEAEMSVAEMQGAWESQIQYLTTYADNIKKAMDFGLDEALIAELSDGSEESAAQLDTIISKVEELGGTTSEAKKFVDDFNAKFQEVETAKDEFAETVADMETDFTEKMQALEDQLNTTIDNMNMETDAATAAKATMSAYIQEIIAGGNSAVAAAANAAARVAAALKTGTATTADGTATYVPKDFIGPLAPGQQYSPYASGTDYASQGIHLVGEHGPELVEFEGGETVYPADETSRILSRIGDAKFHTSPEAGAAVKEEQTGNREEKRTIRLEINGSGAIEVDSTMDEETVVDIIGRHLKPVLAGIVKQEIFEEGDLAYDF